MTDTTPHSKHNAAIDHLLSLALDPGSSGTFHAALELIRSAPADSLEIDPSGTAHELLGLGVQLQDRTRHDARNRHPAGEGLPNPLTREDVKSAVTEALESVTVKTIREPLGRTYNISTVTKSAISEENAARVARVASVNEAQQSQRAARDRHPAGKGLSPSATRNAQNAFVAGHLMGLSFSPDQATREAALALAAALPILDLELTDRAKDLSQCNIENLGIRLAAPDHVVDALDRVTSDDSIVRQVIRNLLHETSPSVDGCGDPTVGEAESVGDASVSSTDKVDDPEILARYDRALNMIAISVDGEDDVYFPRDDAFSFMDDIARALEVQAKLGGAA